MSKVAVIGGGAAGMMAAISAANCGHDVSLYERNEKLGKKVYITGKGRCNVTNACDLEEFFQNIIRNPKFTYSAIYTMDNAATMFFFEQLGLKLKTERGNRVFPVSDHSSDVIGACKRALDRAGVKIYLNTKVVSIETTSSEEDDKVRVCGLRIQKLNGKAELVDCDSVILATGGLSYPVTGSDGNGHRMAANLGHKIKDCSPALVPLNIKEEFVKELQGLSLRNVAVKVKNGKKVRYEAFGEMLFTHFGVSGPLILSASSVLNDQILKGPVEMTIDLKPALTHEQLNKRVLRDFEENQNRQFKNAISGLFPSKLIPVMVSLSGIDPDKQVNAVTREERAHFVDLIKALPITITGFRGYQEAIITRGGVYVKEIDASTMESKLIHNLYICGELLDVDALTGGFNLQVAWSTGNLAGLSIR